jgi:DNA polymerase elongation subunit (family B)
MSTTEQNRKIIPIGDILKYIRAGTPIRPEQNNGDPDVTKLYVNDAERVSLADALSANIKSHVYKNPSNPAEGIKPLNLLAQQIPTTFWNEDRIKRQTWWGISCGVGITGIPAPSDPETKVLFIVGYDADDEITRCILEELLRKLGLYDKTIVQITPSGGMSAAVAVAVDRNNIEKEIADWKRKALLEEECAAGKRMTIKTGNQQITLDPSTSRKEGMKDKPYNSVSGCYAIAENNNFYDLLINKLKIQGCITETPEEKHARREKGAWGNGFDKNVKRYDFTDEQIDKGVAIVLGLDNDGFGSIFIDNQRHDYQLAFSGYCYKHYATLESVIRFTKHLAKAVGYSSSSLDKRLRDSQGTYQHGDTAGVNGLKGATALIELFHGALKDKSDSEDDKEKYRILAEQRLRKLADALGLKPGERSNKDQLELEEDIKLAAEKVTSEDIKFLFSCMKKEAPFDESSIKQLFYGMMTTFTRQPMPHMITSLTAGSGKNYLLELVSKYFPQKYVSPVTRISDKAIFHRNGILVIPSIDPSTGEEITTPLNEIIAGFVADKKALEERLEEEKAKGKGEKKDKELIRNLIKKIAALNLEINTFRGQAEKLIDVNKQIILCLDTPPESFLDMIMSLVSQDTRRDQKYEFAEKSTSGQMGTRVNRVRGTPNVFGTRVTDDTRSERHEERNRRFVPVSPNVSSDKIVKASTLGWEEDSMLDEQFEENSDLTSEQKEKCKHIVASVVAKLNLHTKTLQPKKAGLQIVYLRSIMSAIPEPKDGEVWSMTINQRLRRYLSVITKVNIDSRCRVYNPETKNIRPIPTYSDFREALNLMVNAAANVRIYQATFFNNVYLPLYNEIKKKPLPSDERKGYTATEKVYGFTVTDLCDAIKDLPPPYGGTIGTDELQRKFLYPLVNSGVLSTIRSQIDGRVRIFFPVQETKINPLFEDPDDPRLKITKEEDWPCINLIEESCGTWIEYRHSGGGGRQKKYLLQDPEGNSISVVELANRYLGNPEECFVKAFESKLDQRIDRELAIDILSTSRNKYNFIENPLTLCDDITAEIHNNSIEQSTKPQILQPAIATKIDPFAGKNLAKIQDEQQPLSRLTMPAELPVPGVGVDQLKPAMFEPIPVPYLLLEHVPEFANLATFDTEWYREDLKENRDKGRAGDIYALCLSDNQGNNTKLHIDHYKGDRSAFMSASLDTLEQYQVLVGFSIFSDKDFISDIDHIGMNCNNAGILERFANVKSKIQFLDLQKIFSNNTVKGFLRAADKVAYREESLDAISKAYIGEGKSEGVSGINVEFLQANQQLEYCLRDAQLCYKILQKKNFELLLIINEISQEIKLPFFKTANSGYPTEWWKAKLASIDYQKVSKPMQDWINENMTYNEKKKPNKKTGVKYLGGHVIPPKMGRYVNAVSYDVSSMYPTMANIHNISTETICCECCKDDPTAKVPESVMKDINDYVLDPENKAKKLEPRPLHYWICQKQRGKFADTMKDLIQRKIEYKKAGQKLKEKAMKILMNSGYGSFGNAYFEYQDPRLAELTTAFGQYTLKSLEQLVGKENVIYGDTDSIYLVGANDKIIAEAKDKFNIKLEVDKVWKILFLTGNKKQYVGLTIEGEIIHTTLTGMKSNQPSYYNEVAKQLISKEIIEGFVDTPADVALERVIKHLRAAFIELGLSDNLDKLSFSLESKEPLYIHKNNNIQRQIYEEILEECNNDINMANSRSQAGRVYRYWKVIAKKRSATIHPQKHQLNMHKYREGLFNCIEPVLEVYGMDQDAISRLREELLRTRKILRLIRGIHFYS